MLLPFLVLRVIRQRCISTTTTTNPNNFHDTDQPPQNKPEPTNQDPQPPTLLPDQPPAFHLLPFPHFYRRPTHPQYYQHRRALHVAVALQALTATKCHTDHRRRPPLNRTGSTAPLSRSTTLSRRSPPHPAQQSTPRAPSRATTPRSWNPRTRSSSKRREHLPEHLPHPIHLQTPPHTKATSRSPPPAPPSDCTMSSPRPRRNCGRNLRPRPRQSLR